MKKVVIIGGMATGCKTAARLKRLRPDFQVTILEKLPFVSFSTCGMPFFASGDIDDFNDLIKTPWGKLRDAEFFKSTKGIDVLTQTEVTEVDFNHKIVKYTNTKTSETNTLDYDYLVIATGAKTITPKFQYPNSEKIMTFHSPIDAKKVRMMAQKGEIGKAVIIGGGYIGCELAEALVSLWGIETTIIEKEPHLLPMSLDKELGDFLTDIFRKNSVEVFTYSVVEKINDREDGQFEITLNNGENLSADIVFLCTGVKPNLGLFEGSGLEIRKNGGIKVDNELRTNIPDVWAGGDCIEIKNLITGNYGFYPLGSLANRQGRVIADSIAGIGANFPGCVGAVSIKVFDTIIASSGLNIKKAENNEINYAKVVGAWYDRPDYHPDSKPIFGKLIYEKENLKILGIQMIGKGEVTRYVDTFSAIAAKNGDVYDLINTEHCYTPPHSGPMNPLNFLGAMALEQERSNIINYSYDEFPIDAIIIDLREKDESEAAQLGIDSKNIPFNEYRKHIQNFQKDKTIIFVCQKGPRSYEGAVFFKRAGFEKVGYLGGGVQLLSKIID
ncbi:MAG: FAD-dependent oxidoreductase [Candidatus Kapabacteria bacterium]|nr:FAD-dependent oxidoreductase [Candidatus Kapabacteria bacterium]